MKGSISTMDIRDSSIWRDYCSPSAGFASPSAGLEALEPRLLLDGTAAGAQAVELFGVSAALFVENQGQFADPAVHYAFNGDGANVLFTNTGPVFQVYSRETGGAGVSPVNDKQSDSVAQEFPSDMPLPDLPTDPLAEDDGFITRATQFSVQFDGANTVAPTGLAQAETVYNYHLGDQSTWRDAVPTYETVAYLDLYDGIDLHTWGRRDSLKYEFHVAPGVDYTQISVSYTGIESLSIDAAGALHVQTDLGDLIDPAPYIYQDIAGQRIEVAGTFELIDADTYTFALTGEYDPSEELVIDPDLSWSTYMGGSGTDQGSAIAVDGSGGVYVAGQTAAFTWVSGGFDTSYGGGTFDAFVAKLTSDGGHVWSTYLGGSKYDAAGDIALDGFGDVYVSGSTESPGWTSGGFDTLNEGDYDAFVVKLTPAGGHIWSTYLGGTDSDGSASIAVDNSGWVYVTGNTESDGWVSGGFDTSYSEKDVFVAKLSPVGDHAWSTYLGGSKWEQGKDITVDDSGGVYVTGRTRSPGWTSGGFDTSHNGGYDIFVAKLTSVGDHTWSTYMGGSSDDHGTAIAVDDSGGVYVTGDTSSPGWASGGFDTLHGLDASEDIFVARLTSDGDHVWSTYMGGSDTDRATDIALNGSGGIYVTGWTGSAPWVSGGFDTSHNGFYDAIVAKLTSAGGHVWSSYLGGSDHDYGFGMAVDGSGGVYLTGQTRSSDWISGGFQTEPGGGWDGFLAKLVEPSAIVTIPDSALEQAVREELYLPTSPLTGADLLRLTSLDATNRGIADLTGLERAENLTSLSLGQNEISNVLPLSGLIALEELDLSDNHIRDISAISCLPHLTDLRLNGNYMYLGLGWRAMPVIEAYENQGTAVTYDPQREPGDEFAIAYDMGSLRDDLPPRVIAQTIGDGPYGPADMDLYKVSLDQSRTYRIQVYAQRIGSDLDAQIRVFTPDGVEIASSSSTLPNGLDPYVSLGLQAWDLRTGTYYVGVSGDVNGAYDPAVEGSGTASSTSGLYVLRIAPEGPIPPQLTWDGADPGQWTGDHWSPDVPAPRGGETMIVNSGTVDVSADLATFPAAALWIAHSDTDGTVSIHDDGRLLVTGLVYVGRGGTLSIDGVVTAGELKVSGGRLTNSRGSTAAVSVVGDIVVKSGGTFVAEVGGGGADTLISSRAITLQPDLSVAPDAVLEIIPTRGGSGFQADTYALLTAAGGLTGTFSEVTDLGAYVSVNGNGLSYDYDAGTVTLTLDMDLNPGDGNLDGATDVSDRIIWNDNNFTEGTTWATGDYNGDGATDVADRIIWNNHNFTEATATPAPQAAPPPGTTTERPAAHHTSGEMLIAAPMATIGTTNGAQAIMNGTFVVEAAGMDAGDCDRGVYSIASKEGTGTCSAFGLRLEPVPFFEAGASAVLQGPDPVSMTGGEAAQLEVDLAVGLAGPLVE